MNYIINPAWAYWINVCDNVRLILYIVFGFSLGVGIISGIIAAVSRAEFGEDDDTYIVTLKIAKATFWGIIVTLPLILFLPSKTTLIEMLVAKLATKDNVQITVEGLKSAVDYVIEAIKSLQ